MDRLQQFQNFVEIMALDAKIKSHLDIQADNHKRLQFVKVKREKSIEQNNQLEENLKEIKKESADVEAKLHQEGQKLTTAQEHLSMATNQKQLDSLEKEISVLGQSVDLLEDRGLELLEEIESRETELEKLAGFIKGSLTTIEEISEEVEKDNSEQDSKIKTHEERINFLLNECDDYFKKSFIQINEKYRFKNPLTFLSQRKCRECYMEVDETLRDNVDRNLSLEFCPGCGRIVCPISATSAG